MTLITPRRSRRDILDRRREQEEFDRERERALRDRDAVFAGLGDVVHVERPKRVKWPAPPKDNPQPFEDGDTSGPPPWE